MLTAARHNRLITFHVNAPVHVELAPSRREAVPKSSRRRLAAARGGREQSPGHAGGVERVQVGESTCTRRCTCYVPRKDVEVFGEGSECTLAGPGLGTCWRAHWHMQEETCTALVSRCGWATAGGSIGSAGRYSGAGGLAWAESGEKLARYHQSSRIVPSAHLGQRHSLHGVCRCGCVSRRLITDPRASCRSPQLA
jgi:hypothetical protein